MSLETKHLDARENMAKYHGVNIVSSSCTPCVKEIKPMQKESYVRVISDNRIGFCRIGSFVLNEFLMKCHVYC